MNEDQIVVLVLAGIVLVMFTLNLAFSVRSYRRMSRRRIPERRRTRSAAVRLRGVIKSFILEVGVISIFASRLIAAANASTDVKRWFSLVNGAAISGALLIGGIFLVVSWLVDDDFDDEAVA